MEEIQAQPRRSFTEEFKREAVRLAINGATSRPSLETWESTKAFSTAGSANSSMQRSN